MTVKIRFLLYLESSPELRNGQKDVEIKLSDGATFGDLLLGLESNFGPELSNEIYDSEKHSTRDMVLAIINGVLAHNLQRTDTALSDGDTVIFVPYVSGG